jgi:DNA-binding beta-propeller fold protein YncE
MSNKQQYRSARRGYAAVGAGFLALGLGGVLAPTAAAAATGPDYTIVEAMGIEGVVRVDTATGAVSPMSGVVKEFQRDGSVAITPDGRTAYVAHDTTLTPVSVASGSVGTSIEVGPGAGAVAISPDGSVAYVANRFVAGRPFGTVTPVRLSDGVALAPITVSTVEVTGLAFTPNGKYVYVLGNSTDFVSSVTPIVVATGRALSPIALGAVGDLAGLAQDSIRISPDGKTAYVAARSQPAVFTIDLTTNTLGGQIQLAPAGLGVQSLAISPDGKTLYAGTPSGVVPVTLATGAVRATIGLPDGFDVAEMAITPDGKVLYVSHRHSDQIDSPLNELVPIDLGTLTAGAPIVTNPDSGAQGPFGALAITPDQAPVANVTARATCSVVSFDASGSTVRYGTIVRYAWTFGDGKTAVTTGPRVTHTYDHAGSHAVTVTETDSAGTSTQQVFTGQTLSRNGGPTAVGRVSVATDPCATTVRGEVTAPASTTAGSGAVAELPRTGAQTSAELGTALLLVIGGAGMVTVARRRRS